LAAGKYFTLGRHKKQSTIIEKINKRTTESHKTQISFKEKATTNHQQFSNIASCGPVQINSANTQLLNFERKKQEKNKNKIHRGSTAGEMVFRNSNRPFQSHNPVHDKPYRVGPVRSNFICTPLTYCFLEQAQCKPSGCFPT
jgi:hypothetical protein